MLRYAVRLGPSMGRFRPKSGPSRTNADRSRLGLGRLDTIWNDVDRCGVDPAKETDMSTKSGANVIESGAGSAFDA